MAGKVESKKLEEYENENYYLLWWSDKRHFRNNCLGLSDEKITRSHGPITLWMWMFSTALHLMYSLTGIRNFARKEEFIYETIAALASNAGHLGWQFTITKASNGSHFHIPLIFCSLVSQPCSIRYFFSLFDTFSHFGNLKNAVTVQSLYHKDSNMFRLLNKVKSCSAEMDG